MNRDALAQLSAEVWAIHKPALQSIVARLDSMELPRGTSLFGAPSAEQMAEIDRRNQTRVIEPQAATRRGPKSGTVAVVPVHGVITRRDSFLTFLFGGTSVERLNATISDLAGNDAVSTIVLDVDSPGGSTSGLPELAATVRAARDAKNVVAIANPVMASAAYWIACQSDEVISTDEGLVGSVGVFTMHEDWSKMLADMGIAVTYIYAGKYKTEGNYEEPLSDEAKAHMQGIVDEAYRLFVNDVALGRRIDAGKVKSDYGEGRVLTARDSKAVGLIDRVASFGDTLGRLTGTRGTAAVAAEGGDKKIIAGPTTAADDADATVEVTYAKAVPSHDTATDDDDWDAAAEEKKLPSPMSASTARGFYAWIDEEQIEDDELPKAAGKFGHHRVSDDGKPGAASTKACSAGIAVLNGGRGGSDIPEDDRDGVHAHLTAHIEDADKEAPELDGKASVALRGPLLRIGLF